MGTGTADVKTGTISDPLGGRYNRAVYKNECDLPCIYEAHHRRRMARQVLGALDFHHYSKMRRIPFF